MANNDTQTGKNNKKWISLAIVLLIVVAAGVFNKDVIFNLQKGEVSITSSTKPEDKTIIIKQINSQKPDFVILKNTTQKPIDIKGYELSEGTKTYKIPASKVNTNLAPNENIKIYFVPDDHPLLSDTTKLVSTSFKIKSGESIELKDSLGNIVDLSKAL